MVDVGFSLSFLISNSAYISLIDDDDDPVDDNHDLQSAIEASMASTMEVSMLMIIQ